MQSSEVGGAEGAVVENNKMSYYIIEPGKCELNDLEDTLANGRGDNFNTPIFVISHLEEFIADIKPANGAVIDIIMTGVKTCYDNEDDKYGLGYYAIISDSKGIKTILNRTGDKVL
ncbi:MAG: hypothetical protein AAFY36_18180, partial [Bacteroidota bacterium]